MDQLTNQQLIAIAIKRLNWLYGVGDVSNVRMFADGRITFDQTPYGCKPRHRVARIQGNTVFALRHQMQITQSKL